ncbi:MAG TPA: hypothetical protein PLN48_11290 [Lachnospiraceae bacterium]|nr:hypothetical protein [Lachnospiraceae bacterium]
MELYIQMGHGMQTLALDHLQAFGSGTFIISPLNIPYDKLRAFSKRLLRENGKLLFDPQMYYVRKYQKNLTKYPYWPQSDITNLENGVCDEVVKSLSEINVAMGTEAFILPSQTVSQIDKRWNAVQESIIESAKKYSNGQSLMHTIALSSDVLSDETAAENIISYVSHWDVESVYIVCEHPGRFYLIDKPLWISNLLSLVTGIKRQGKKVIVGYASQQMLCLALAKCDAIASGNFLNVRWFQPNHFETIMSDEISRRAVWYYCPQALSEFKIPFLDIAKRMSLLEHMQPAPDMMNENCDMLFSSALPSATGYSEKNAHRHYLYCLRKQCESAVKTTYDETMFSQQIVLETADKLLSGLREKGIRGQDRDFGEVIDVNRAALAAHTMNYQYVLQHEWNNL